MINKNRKQQEIDFKRNLITDAAKVVFFAKGFENATMEDVAKEAGYSKGAIYSYFDSKNEICYSIVNGYFYKISKFIKKIAQGDGSGLVKLIEIKDKFISDFTSKEDFCKIFESFRYHQNQCTQVEKQIIKNNIYNKTINGFFEDIIVEGMNDGSFKKSIDSKKLATAFWNMESSFISELRSIKTNSYDYIFDLIIESIKK